VENFKKLGAAVLGISPDKPETQKKFEEKQALKVPLLSDTDRKVLEAYGAFGEKKMYGKIVRGVIRSTFLVDPESRIMKVWSKVRVDGHAEEVLEYLEGLSTRG
jgi:peroxiredoxin Q/BCP